MVDVYFEKYLQLPIFLHSFFDIQGIFCNVRYVYKCCNCKTLTMFRDGKSKVIYHWVYIDMSDKSREIYRYILYIRRNILTNYFFLNKHPSSHKHFPHQWQFFGRFIKIDTNHYLFSNTQSWKINNHFLHRIFSISIHLSWKLKVLWKLLRTIIYSLKLEKLIITFFRKKNEKSEFVTTDIYRKIYRYTPTYRTPIYWYKYSNISNATHQYFIVAILDNVFRRKELTKMNNSISTKCCSLRHFLSSWNKW